MKFHHIGIATENIEVTAKLLSYFGYSIGETMKDPLQNVWVKFLSHPTEPTLELIGRSDDHSPIDKIVAQNGTSIYHICYETRNLEQTIVELREQGYLPIGKKKKSLIDGQNVIFLYHKDNFMLELLEMGAN